MYKILRRISSSFFPSPDQPWNEDATSTAPQIGQKRRLSSTEPEPNTLTTSAKKRREGIVKDSGGSSQREESPVRPGKDTEEVKQVTKGVGEVELDETKTSRLLPTEDAAAAIPLPDSLPDSPTLQATQETQEAETRPEVAQSVESSTGVVAVKDTEQVQQKETSTPAEADPTEARQEGQEQAVVQEEDEEIPGLTAGAEMKVSETAQPASAADGADEDDTAKAVATEQTTNDP